MKISTSKIKLFQLITSNYSSLRLYIFISYTEAKNSYY